MDFFSQDNHDLFDSPSISHFTYVDNQISFFLLQCGHLRVFKHFENCFCEVGFACHILLYSYQVTLAQWLARRLATGEDLGSNSGKGENNKTMNKKENLPLNHDTGVNT